jgi:hypothetical protein
MSIDFLKLEQERLNDANLIKNKISKSGGKSFNAKLILNATPEGLKPKGINKLPLLLFGTISQIPQILQPSLNELITKYIPDPNSCGTNEQLNELLVQRNDIVQILNNIGNRIEQTGRSITGISTFLNTILNTIRIIDNASIIASLALKIAPLSPGAAVSLLNDTQTFIRKTTFDSKGNSRLSQTEGVINSSSLVISLAGVYILNVKNLLNIIDLYLSKCNNNTNIIPISKNINDIADSQSQANETQNLTTYQGFIIEIEEVPFTSTVTRRRAIGKNQSGIKLIQSELSFSTSNQTLIDELKFIIDRDNLKAY